jgi:hypothetical protein
MNNFIPKEEIKIKKRDVELSIEDHILDLLKEGYLYENQIWELTGIDERDAFIIIKHMIRLEKIEYVYDSGMKLRIKK